MIIAGILLLVITEACGNIRTLRSAFEPKIRLVVVFLLSRCVTVILVPVFQTLPVLPPPLPFRNKHAIFPISLQYYAQKSSQWRSSLPFPSIFPLPFSLLLLSHALRIKWMLQSARGLDPSAHCWVGLECSMRGARWSSVLQELSSTALL
jgi:hypothetical protein